MADNSEEQPNLDAQENGTEQYHDLYFKKIAWVTHVIVILTVAWFIIGRIYGWWSL